MNRLKKTPPKQMPASFEVHVRAAAQDLRVALTEGLASANVEATKAQSISRQLGLDKSLGWKVARIISDDDVLAAASLMPGRAGLAIVQRSLAKAGASDDSLKSLELAIQGFDRMVELHCGDRDTLDMMLGHMYRDTSGPGELVRRKAFQGNSAIWGVQARVRLVAQFMSPSHTRSGMVDLATISGLLDFRRLRSDVPWTVASVWRFADDGSPQPPGHHEPMDTLTEPDAAPLIREHCSTPTPVLRVAERSVAVTRYELVEGPVGNTAACTCVVGWIYRDCASAFRTEGDRYGEHLGLNNTPAELALHDLFVHRDVMKGMPPTAHLYSQLPGGPVYPQSGRERGELPLSETMIDLGASPPDLVAAEVPQYRKLIELGISRLGWESKDFVGYRIKLRYPPIPTVLLFRHVLPEAPDKR